MTTELTMWEDEKALVEIKNLFAPKLNPLEFKAFVGLGKATGLNPFLREIWSVKYADSSPAQIFIGRDGYRKAAQKNPEYDYHQSDAVFDNDSYKVIKGEIEHEYNLKNRGNLIGAYCVVKRHSSTRPIYVYVDLREYNTNQSVWKTKPATMIKKVAEAQALRAAFQEQFGGSYSEDEEVAKISGTDRLKERLNIRTVNDNEHPRIYTETKDSQVNEETGEVNGPVYEVCIPKSETASKNPPDNPIQIDQLTAIRDMMNDKNFTVDRKKKALAQFNAQDATELSSEDADTLIEQLERTK